MEKFFCIGFQKTGTTTIASALEILGYKVAPELWRPIEAGAYEPPLTKEVLLTLAHEQVSKYEVFADNPWPLIWAELEQFYPEARFILITRDENDWYHSLCRMFRSFRSPMQDYIYGGSYPEDDKEGYIKRFRKHNADVKSYFATKPQKLLEMSISKGLDWKPICEFVNLPIPDIEFPHKNRAYDRDRQLKWYYLRLTRIIKKKYKSWL